MSGPVDLPSPGVPIKAWVRGVPVADNALEQLQRTAELPFVHHHLAVMPDVHFGIGATIGSVIPTVGAIVPAAVGVDLGCGMCAVETSLRASDLPDDLRRVRGAIEKAVPHGRTVGRGKRDQGAWGTPPRNVLELWREHLEGDFQALVARYPELEDANHVQHLGTLGTGNHFIEVCMDERDVVWLLLHSGSRGIGNKIARVFIELAKEQLGKHWGELPDQDLAWLEEDSRTFVDYVEAVDWAQRYAALNRRAMLEAVIEALRKSGELPQFRADVRVVDCHHNYVARERHYGKECLVTRKGAVRAGRGDWGIVPGSMGAKSYVVRGKGNPESFESCSHGAGRVLSRGEAKRRYGTEDHARATAHVECRKDAGVIDETPMAYKDIDAVMAAQGDLVEVVHTLRQVVCVKG